jgi:hypothetical protein
MLRNLCGRDFANTTHFEAYDAGKHRSGAIGTLRSMPASRIVLRTAIFPNKAMAGSVVKQILLLVLDWRHQGVVSLMVDLETLPRAMTFII